MHSVGVSHNKHECIEEKLRTKDLGELTWCLGIKTDVTTGTVTLTQPNYIRTVLERFGLTNCKAVSTPALERELLEKHDGPAIEPDKYRELIGCLVYLASTTRPDIANSVRAVAQQVQNPGEDHWRALKRIARYLKGTEKLGLTYAKDGGDIKGYVDADFANEDGRKSISGYVIMLAGCAISWGSRKQSLVTTSTAEAEYVAISDSSKVVIRMLRISKFLGELTSEMVIYEDNQACIATVKNEKIPQRTKHIDVKYHHIRELVQTKKFDVQYIKTRGQLADLFTKNLGRSIFEKHRAKIMNGPISNRGSVGVSHNKHE